jgi:iron(III) transport system permease protein
VAGAVAIPLVHLVVRALESERALDELFTGRVARFVTTTVTLAAVTTAIGVFVGVGAAWLVERTNVAGRGVLRVLAVLPLAVPTYVSALTILAAFGPQGIVADIPALVGFWGSAIVLTLSTYPYVFLISLGVLRQMDPAIEEAATTLGDSPWVVFHRVVLPQLRPAMTGGGLLIFLYVLSDFGAVSIMRIDTLTRAIFLEYRSSFDRATAALLGLVLVALTLAAISGERALRGRTAPARAVAGARIAAPVPLRQARWPLGLGVAALGVVGSVLPVAVLVHWAVSGEAGVEAGSITARAAAVSVQVSVAAAVVAVVAATPIAFLSVRHRSWFARVTETVSVSGYALPGLVIALAMVFAATQMVPALYHTLTLVVIAYVIRFLPESLGAVRASLGQVDPALEEAARSLGRTRFQAVLSVTVPLVRSGALSGAALVFLTAMKELPATLLLRPPGYDTLATRVWTAASQGTYGRAAPAALLLVAVSAVALWPLQIRRARQVASKVGG